MYPRTYLSPSNRSFFLFGARGTGKSSWLKRFVQGKNALYVDLLDVEQEDRFRQSPKSLENEYRSLKKKPDWIILDEVQRVPKLLDTVHRMIENDKVRFALSGSSARKLKRGASNLLAGRAFVHHLFPLTHIELGKDFDLNQVLCWGSLPQVFSLSDVEKSRYLRAYTLTYLNEEIRAEQVVRKLEPFRDFLGISAQQNGKLLNHSKIGKEVGTDNKIVKSYFQILEDTWMGFHLPAFHRSLRKAQRQHPKFFWFDLGVKRALEQSFDMLPTPGTSYFGECFEHFITLEIYRLNHYLEKDYRLSYFMTQNSQVEIDLILSKGNQSPVLIEIKSNSKIDEQEVKKLALLSKEFKSPSVYYLSQDAVAQKIENVYCLHWKEGIKRIFGYS